MSEDFILNAEARDDQGKGASRRLRHEGKLPAIIYGAGEEPKAITLIQNDVIKHLDHEAFYSHILTIKIDGQKDEKALLRDVQRHPSKAIILHMDLLRVDEKQAIRHHVPLHFMNEDTCVGVKVSGGVISHNLTELEVQCLPSALPEYIEVDLLEVDMDQVVHMSDLKLPKGVELVELLHGDEHDQPVASVHQPVVVKVEDDDESPAEDDAAEEDSAE